MVFSVYSCVSLLFMSRRLTTLKNIRPWPRPDLKKSYPVQP